MTDTMKWGEDVSSGLPAATFAAPFDEHVRVGDVIRADAVDWSLYGEQLPGDFDGWEIIRGTLYGRVVEANDEFVVLAPQVFADGGTRNAIGLPWATIHYVRIYEREVSHD